MSELSLLLKQTLDPSARKQAEQQLAAAERTGGFAPALLQLIESQTDPSIRFAGAVYFKNFVKKYWKQIEGEPDYVSESDRQTIKQVVVQLMISVPNALQLQISEAVSIIADNDFPAKWQQLIQELVGKLSLTDHQVNIGVLQTAHSIFKRWRHQFRSDTLYIEIKFVLEQFAPAYLSFFQEIDKLVDANQGNAQALAPLLETVLLLCKLFLSMNSQDLPEFFEDHQAEFMHLLAKYLNYANPNLASDPDEAGTIEKTKSVICEIIDLYARQYEEDFKGLNEFVKMVWVLLTTVTTEKRYDYLVSKALGFLTSVVKLPRHKQLFEAPETLQRICTDIVLPNMTLRETDEELFEDDPIEFIRRDLEGSDNETRRRAAADLVRGLLELFAKEVTEIFSAYINQYLEAYTSNPVSNWKAKDTALFLITSLSAKAVTAHSGATQTNEYVQVLPVFASHVIPDLQKAVDGEIHPIIKVDAIKYLTIFRSQLNKAQLLEIFPSLARHLQSTNYVVYTWTAHCIERILAMKIQNEYLKPEDVKPFAGELLQLLFELIRKGGTPQKMAENEYLMRSVLRIILRSKHELTVVEPVIQSLTFIITEISKNPSNPKFNHYTFEALASLVKAVCVANPALVVNFEGLLFPPFQQILANDVAEFMPYVFQILAQLLSLHSDGVPPAYAQMLPPLLLPVLWENHGNVPALVSLLNAYLARGANTIVQQQQLVPILGVCQKLLASRLNDGYGFDLLNGVFKNVPSNVLAEYVKNIFILLLTRLSQSKTPKFSREFLNFISFLLVLEKPGLAIDDVLGVFEQIQPGMFRGLLETILIPEFGELMTVQDRHQCAIGMTRLLTQSNIMLSENYFVVFPRLLNGIIELMHKPEPEVKQLEEEDVLADLEDTGYQASFARLATVALLDQKKQIKVDPNMFLAQSLAQMRQTQPAKAEAIIQSANQDNAKFLQEWMQGVAPR
ncbi:Cse1-domain-containing protein [Gorgonomyces haynaldii]|nr:Cse1-domain-containing protein [Gorgonomyces haynaldii]